MRRAFVKPGLCAALLLSSAMLLAQTGTIRGFVYDKATGEPIIFTNVVLKGTTTGAATDVNGYFSITKVPVGQHTLLVTFRGYSNLEKKDQGCAPLEVAISPLSPMMSSVSYEWNIEGQSPGVFPTYSMNSTLSFYNNSDTVQRYKITFKAYNICKDEVKTSWVSVLPFPKAKIGIDGVETGCSPLTLTFINQSNGNVDGCNWNFGNDSLVSDCKIYIPVTFLAKDTTRIYNILLKVQNEFGQSSITREIAVSPTDIHSFRSAATTWPTPRKCQTRSQLKSC